MVICIFCVSGSFVCCGGNDDDSSGVTQMGYFVDGPVEGLSYSTGTQSGQTGADGSFYYEQGETVEFYIGDILIGRAAGASTISPFDLVGITPPQTGIEIRRALYLISHQGSPLEQVANIAAFMQTMDEDGDLTNGIQIPYLMHTLAAGVTIDFSKKWRFFRKDFSLRTLVANGRDAGLWGGSRQIRHPAYALATLYDGLGITPMNYVNAIRSIDSDVDGTVDSRYTYTHDASGNRTMEVVDSNADGTVDSHSTYTFDAHGNWTMTESDSNADGTVDDRITLTYDANGDRTMREQDIGADGTVDNRSIYTYDANGNQAQFEQDLGADGTVDSRYTYTHDANGNRTMEEVDSNADGTVDSRSTYTHDANGNQTMWEYDFNADGTVDARRTSTYDANGDQTVENDYDADGTVDKCQTYIYDTIGNTTMEEVDSNADGTVDSRYTYTHDANGDTTLYEVDSNADGTVDKRTSYTKQLVTGWIYYYYRYQ